MPDERIQRDQPCGYCMAKEHKKCASEVRAFGRPLVWLCGCKTCWPTGVDKVEAEE